MDQARRSDSNVSDMSSPYGAKLSSDSVQDVPVESLRFGYTPRKGSHDDQHVSVLAETLNRVPPIVVHAATMTVIDGAHRVLAARSIGQKTVRAVYFHGDEHEAKVLAIWSNVTHGKPLATPERRVAARQLITSNPEWSDRRLAAVCGLSPKTIAQLRATVDAPQSRARLGRDGRYRTAEPVDLRLRIASELRSNPAASNRAISATTGSSPHTVADVRDRLARQEDVIPPALQANGHRRRPDDREQQVPAGDSAYAASEARRDFAAWFQPLLVRDDDWRPFVTEVPRSRIYEVADAARECGKSWLTFATELEKTVAERRSSRAG